MLQSFPARFGSGPHTLTWKNDEGRIGRKEEIPLERRERKRRNHTFHNTHTPRSHSSCLDCCIRRKVGAGNVNQLLDRIGSANSREFWELIRLSSSPITHAHAHTPRTFPALIQNTHTTKPLVVTLFSKLSCSLALLGRLDGSKEFFKETLFESNSFTAINTSKIA